MSEPEAKPKRKVVQMEPCRYHDKLDEILQRLDERTKRIVELLEKGHSGGETK